MPALLLRRSIRRFVSKSGGEADLSCFWEKAKEICGQQDAWAALTGTAQNRLNLETFRAATRALGQITNPAVRDLAFQLVGQHNEGREDAITMLNRNYLPGDHQAVLSWFESETDRHISHGMQTGLRAFWEHHPEPNSEAAMLHTLYNLGPCSTCRDFVVQRLLQLNALTPEMRRECAYDANDKIRSALRALQET